MRYSERKTVQVIAYFVWKLRKCTKLPLLKLIFLADRYHVRKFGRLITGNKYVAMQYGPVASETKTFIEKAAARSEYAKKFFSVRLTKGFDGKKRELLETVSAPLFSMLSRSEIEAMDAAVAQMPMHSDLVAYTHRFPEWKKHETALKTSKMRKMDVADFFESCNPADEYCDAPQELVELNRESFFEL